jgi:hypothetical protein
MAQLATKLNTLKKVLSKNQIGKGIADAHALYLYVLQAVTIPVLGGAPKKHKLIDNKVNIKPSSKSIAQDQTIYICLASMQAFKTNLAARTQIMKDIPTLEAQAFSRAGTR